jgi:membrane protein
MFQRIWNHASGVFWKTAELWQEDDGFLLSAAMAYYAAFSLFPLCLVLVAILGFVLRMSQQAADARKLLLEELAQHTTLWLSDKLGTLLEGVQSHAAFGGPFGAIALLFAAIVVFLQLDYMFDRIFGVPKTDKKPTIWRYLRTVLFDRLYAFLMLMIVLLLLLALFVANLVLHGIQSTERFQSVIHQVPGREMLWYWGQFVATVVTNALLITMIYKFLPKVRVRWRDALAGGLLVSLVWLAGQRLLVRLLIGPTYTAYGIVGTFIAVMIWVYYVSAILFLGAEFIEALAIVAGRATKAKR